MTLISTPHNAPQAGLPAVGLSGISHATEIRSAEHTQDAAGSPDGALRDDAASALDGAGDGGRPDLRELRRAQRETAALMQAQEAVVRLAGGGAGAAAMQQAQALYTLTAHRLQRTLPLLPPPIRMSAADSDTAIDTGAGTGGALDSSADFWHGIANGIDVLKAGYLGVYEESTRKSNEMLKEFVAVQGALHELTEFQEKDMYIYLTSLAPGLGNFDAERVAIVSPPYKPGLLDMVNAIAGKYGDADGPDSPGVLHVAKTAAEAREWAASLGMPADRIKSKGGRHYVMVDIGPLKGIAEGLAAMEAKDGNGTGTGKSRQLQPTGYNVWKNGFDAQADKLKNTASTLASKLANAQSIYENLIKILSATITAMAETDKSFLTN